MSKSNGIIFAGALALLNCTADGLVSIASERPDENGVANSSYVRVIPKDTKIPVVLMSPLNSSSEKGDQLQFKTMEDISVDGSIAVPNGSQIDGEVVTHGMKGEHDPYGVDVKFTCLHLPGETKIPIVAILVSRQGAVHAKRGLKDITIPEISISAPPIVGTQLCNGLVSVQAAKQVQRQSKLSVAEAIAIESAAGLKSSFNLDGRYLNLKPGDELKIELDEDLRIEPR